MKKYLVTFLLICFFIPTISQSQRFLEKQKQKQRELVKRQRESDLKRKEALLRKMKVFMTDINKQLGFGNKTKIDTPVDINDATDIKKNEHYHTNKKIPPKKYAYVNARRVNMRSDEKIGSNVIGKVIFREKVELVVQSEKEVEIQGVKNRWILVKKANEDEGWVFGAFLQKKIPKKKETIDTIKNDTTGGSKDFALPTRGRISSRFGYRVHPVTRRRQSFHKGLDIAAPRGTPVNASAAGIVQVSKYNRNGYGNLIVIEHEKNLSTYYGHLSKRLTSRGRRVAKGQLIGNVGSTGMSTGPHLHFEVRRGRKALNPDAFLK